MAKQKRLKVGRLEKLLKRPENLAKIAKQMLMPITKDKIYNEIVADLIRRFDVPCAKCQQVQYGHKETKNHPYFAGNLEMLEWEYEHKKNNNNTSL
jgi:hypothetical protein